MSWQSLTATHYWDCNGGSCDATTLQPWDEELYSFAPHYAPMVPEGGVGQYGETLWLVGAASDELSALLGPDDSCCGRDDTGSGGCGKCVLVRNPTAANNLTAVVMKKSRCPPETNMCDGGAIHMDIAVPGFEFISESTANICGDKARLETWLSESESGSCSASGGGGGDASDGGSSCDCSWTGASKANCGADDGSECWSVCCGSAAATASPPPPLGSCCDALAGSSPERRRLRSGCELFRSWGWPSGAPTLEFQTIACPPAFTATIATAFTATGVGPLPSAPAWEEVYHPRSPPSPPLAPNPSPAPPLPAPLQAGLSEGALFAIVFGSIIGLVMFLVWGRHNPCPRWVQDRCCGRRPSGAGLTTVRGKRVRGVFAAATATGRYDAPAVADRRRDSAAGDVELTPPAGLVEPRRERVEVL